MSNLYGVATPNPLPQSSGTIGSTDVVCASGSETNFISLAPALPTVAGVYYPLMQGWLTVSLGASAPTLITINARVNNGADLLNWNVAAAQYVANTSFITPAIFHCYNLIIQNPTGVYNFQVSVTPTAQPVTVRFSGTVFYLQWIRASDQ